LASKTVSADQGNPIGTLKNLWPYMWPADRPDLKMRVLWASVFLLLSKIVLILVPYFFKWATDALNGDLTSPGWLPAVLATPVMLVIAYNTVRLVQWGFNQLRDALFARVGQHAVRQLAFRTFTHLHELSLRFHLQRRTGGLSRVIERGVKGIETIVRFTILNALPTLIEFAWSPSIFGLSSMARAIVAVLAVTVWLYIWFTVVASQLAHRRSAGSMNDIRHRRQLQGRRFPAQFRDGQIFQQRADGSPSASIPRWPATRRRRPSGPGLARLAQHRPGVIFTIGMTVLHGDVGEAVMAGDPDASAISSSSTRC
jgi:ABC-type multidrug transport system fused ATPase/permease subunit